MTTSRLLEAIASAARRGVDETRDGKRDGEAAVGKGPDEALADAPGGPASDGQHRRHAVDAVPQDDSVGGVGGAPRRTADPTHEGVEYVAVFGKINGLRLQIALGGVILSLSLVLFFIHLGLSWFDIGATRSATEDTIPLVLSGPENTPRVLENLRLWTGIAIVLVLLTYVLPTAATVFGNGRFGQVEHPAGMVEPIWLLGLDIGRQHLTALAGVIL